METSRSVLLPDECYDDFLIAMAQAKADGIPEREFRMQRMAENGWTEQLEQVFTLNLSSVGKLAQLGMKE